MQSHIIPRIDFCKLSANNDIEEIDDLSLEEISKPMIEAFQTTGFLFLLNSGVTEEEVTAFNHVTETFFRESHDVKQRFSRKQLGGNHGWVAIEEELLEPGRPSDMKESFQVSPIEATSSSYWPNNEFKDVSMQFFNKLAKIAHRVMLALAVGLNLDKKFFLRVHNIGDKPNRGTSMRSLFYPAMSYSDIQKLKPGQQRCGLHTDYGSVTLLLSDNLDGLQVKDVDGSFIEVKSRDPTAVLVNLGDLMQKWTNNKLLATEHRVLFPKMDDLDIRGDDKNEACIVVPKRRSTAFFVHPDDDTLIFPLGEDQIAKSVVASEYLQRRFDATYL